MIVSRFPVAEIEKSSKWRSKSMETAKKKNSAKRKNGNSRGSLDWSAVEDIDEGRRTHTMRMRPRVQRKVNTLELWKHSKQSYNTSTININSSTNTTTSTIQREDQRLPQNEQPPATERCILMPSSTQIIGLSWLRTPYDWTRGSEVSPEGMRPNLLSWFHHHHHHRNRDRDIFFVVGWVIISLIPWCRWFWSKWPAIVF